MTEHRAELHKTLWDIANDLRGSMGADEFRNYILGTIFYKYLSERITDVSNKALEGDNIHFTAIDENTPEGKQYITALEKYCITELGYFVSPKHLFSAMIAKSKTSTDAFILDDLSAAFNEITNSTMGAESEDDFSGLFNDVDLTSNRLGNSVNQRNELMKKVLNALDSSIKFSLDETEIDVLGDAYEYLIGMFASSAGKKAGEYYTPQQVSTILARIVTTGKDKLRDVYDPTCGSGSLLLRVAKEVKDVGQFYGQEKSHTTYNLARMNMLLHNVKYNRFDIRHEDTLENPQHDPFQQFEAIVANPPFSAKWSASSLFMDDDRFSPYGKLAPSSKADYAFVTHMLHHLDDSGTMALVLPHGALFRGAAEGHIRKHIIEEYNWLDAVIGLPANIFYGTSIPTCIMVFKKNRSFNDAVLFIDASNEFEKQKNQNYLKAEHIDKIVQTYRDREALDKYSYNAALEEIRENDYNLNIPRYVDTFEEEEPVDLKAVQAEIKAIDAELAKVEEELNGYLKELGL